MAKIQDFFRGAPKKIDIPPGEYEGPLVINYSCIVDGHGATLWAKLKAALVINADNVTIKNLRVERIESTANVEGAVQISGLNAQLENVEIYGGISDSQFNFPRTINFGTFAADEQNEFLIKFDEINEKYRVLNKVAGLNVEPQFLSAKQKELKLIVEPLREGTIIFGNLFLEVERSLNRSKKLSKILHRIYISGRAIRGAAIQTLPKIQEPPPLPIKKPARQTQPIPYIPASNQIKSGQTVRAPKTEILRVTFSTVDKPADMTIDAYAFCLGKNKKVKRETDLIFFNNPTHESLGVMLDKEGIGLNLKNLPAEIQSVVIFFGIYDEGNRAENNFSILSAPKITIWADENIFSEFPVRLGQAKIFKSLEIYRDKGDWQINFIGVSTEKDFASICKFYGVEVL